MTDRPLCRGTTAKGAPCKNKATAGSAYCGPHGGGARATHRPTKLNDLVADTILEHVRNGLTLEVAAQAAGISRETLSKWRTRGEDDLEHGRDSPYATFAEGFTRAYAEGEERLVADIRRAGLTDWRASAWLLERTRRERYARRAGEESIDPAVAERAAPREVVPTESKRDTILGILAAATKAPPGLDQ